MAAAMATQSVAASLCSSFTGNRNVFSMKKNVVVQATQRCNRLTVRASQGNYIPAEHRFLYEGVEKMGPDVWNTTYYPKADDHKNLEKTWYIVDAADKRLGRLASTVAVHIRGKNLAEFTPSVDMGAYVIVVNAEKVGVTGKKRSQKLYRRHSGRPGGMKIETFNDLQKRIPERIVEHAVRGMLPKGRLGRRLFTHLKVYTGPEHPHVAQQPLPLPIVDKRIDLVRS
ncbi:hypothetical protein R1sor_020331 [Riccia sorocarpa]|uniref:Large ribosomal subunit protein uL13c n=1 Tax=Riccia sorocarpa TaxID=122646 RepID=A0ABD3IGQ5_9MARC